MLDALQYFVVLQAAIFGAAVKKIAQQLSANFATQILWALMVTGVESLRLPISWPMSLKQHGEVLQLDPSSVM
jgi:hypothetical protein